MRKFFSQGDGVPLTTVTLLVLGPVFFGLVLAVFYPVLDPSWWNGLISHPAKHLTLIIWFLLIVQILVGPSLVSREEFEDSSWSGLYRAADIVWAMAVGMLLCLMIVVDKDAVETGEDVAAYVVVALFVLNLGLRWRDRRERRGFGQNRVSELR